MNRELTIALMGPPGCGKGTQARALSERLGLEHLSSGDIIRDHISHSTDLGKAFEEATARGELGPTHLVTGIMKERLSGLIRNCRGCVLDGFPRTIEQARMLAGLGLPDVAVSLAVDSDRIIPRITGRLSCACGASYHREATPPKDPGTCDRCKNALFTRPDDREDTVRVRMDEYARETLPLLDFYRDGNRLIEIDGTGSREAVTKRIIDSLDRLTR